MVTLLRHLFAVRRPRKRRNGSKHHGAACLIEHLEDRSLLSAANPIISMSGVAPTILPSVNGMQLLALVQGNVTQLYTTDGTQAGTVAFTELPASLTMSSDGTFRDFAVLGNQMIFSASGPEGRELWKTNGTAGGTQLVLDINPGIADSSPAEFSLFNGFVYFAATKAASGRELWRTNGLAAGTSLVADVVSGSGSSDPAKLVSFDSQLFFATLANNDVYRTDGTGPGTTLVADGDFSDSRLPFIGTYPVAVVNGRLILKREHTSTGVDLLSYASASAQPDVIAHDDLNSTPGAALTGIDAFAVAGDKLYFRSRTYFRFDWHPLIDHGSLFVTDGSLAGTQLINRDLFAMEFPNDQAISFPHLAISDGGTEKLIFRDSGPKGVGAVYLVNGTSLAGIPASDYARPFNSEFVQLGSEIFELRETGLRKIDSTPLLVTDVPAADKELDGPAKDLRLMLGSLWFATPQALWKYDATAPARVAGPTIVSPGTWVGLIAGNPVPSELTIAWNAVPNAVSYDFEVSGPAGTTGYRSVSGTQTIIDYNELGLYTARVRAVLANGQVSETSLKTFTAVAVPQMLTFVRELPLEEKLEFSITDADFTPYAFVIIADRKTGQVIQNVPVIIPAGSGTRISTVSLPKSLLTLRRDLTLRVAMVNDVTAPSAEITINVQYKPLSVTMTGNNATISWPAPAGATAYDLWIDDDLNKVTQFIRNQNLVDPVFTSSFAPGTYRAWVRAKLPSGALTNWSNSIAFTTGGTMRVSNPVGTLNEGAGDETFVWSQVKNATGYELWVNDASNIRILHQPDLGGSTTSYLAPLDFQPGAYTAWVRPKFTGNTFGAWSPPQRFTIKARPISISLVDGPVTETFKWSSVRTAVGFELWVNNAAGVRVIHQPDLPSTSTSFVHNALLDAGSYFAWVRPKLPGNTPGPWSPMQKFTIVPRAIVITGGVGQVFDTTPAITWNAASYATSYEVWISRKGETTAVYHRQNLSALTASHVVDVPLALGEYEVWVRARDAAGITSRWGSPASMLIGFGTSNSTVQLVANTRTITWAAIPGAIRYDLWVDYLGSVQPAENQIIRDSTLTTNTYVIPAALPSGNFRAWVRAIHVENGVTFTSIWSVYAGNFKLS